MDWDPQIEVLFDKYDDKKIQYTPTEQEWELLSSPEYAFYEAWKTRPIGKIDTGLQIRNVRGWFSSALGGDWNTSVADWICELTQNAFDRDATKCFVEIDNDDRKINFGHNGKGIQGPKDKGQLWGEVIALRQMGISLKNYDLHSEGRFGVGFKYWMKHFHQVIITANNLTMGWTKGFDFIEPSRKDMGPWEKWTLFSFSGPGTGGKKDPLDIQINDLHRLKDAIRMRPDDFELEVTIREGGKHERFSWEHRIASKYEIDGITILNCKDQQNKGGSDVKRSTLMLIPANSDIFPDEHVVALTKDFIKTVDNANARRKDLKEPEIEGKPSDIVQKYFSMKPLIFGFFHGEEDFGSILSMFPISNEGKTSSRISFSAPFEIEPTRLELKKIHPQMLGPPERNRILIQMMIHSYGQFLKIILNKDEDIIDQHLVRFIMENPPGQMSGDGEELDEKIREYATYNFAAKWVYGRKELQVNKVLISECWPTFNEPDSGLCRIGGKAKQLDPLLIEYRKSLLDGGKIDDIQWLMELLEAETIIYGKDQYGFFMPVCNWITELLSQEEGVGYSGIDLLGEYDNAS